ncbi:hypothetical protein N7537_003633 [Penicillium hordei]|uniref:Uncharacterized protein n=1 Tax=Penicillium hordei TaxID=40994 RepID=A0AAD6EA22_9EURO|nr:uncharacterized protein N7537_003633 [Penicillium hordei]KAJ5607014.1 hypothetical protein N7537_003633 [Penicillium hordei]
MEEAQQSVCDDCQEALVVSTEENAEPIHLHQHDPHLFLANCSDGLYWQASGMYETQSIPNGNHAEVNSSQSIEFNHNLNFQNLALPSIQQPVIAGPDPNFGDGYSFVPAVDCTQPEYLLGYEENIFDHLVSNDYRFTSTSSLFGAPNLDNQYAQHDAYSTLGDSVYPQTLESELLVVFSIGQNEDLGKIMTGLPAPLRTEGVIIWKVALEILLDLLTNDDYQRKGMSFAERVSATACLRSKDASLLPPILFSNPEHLGTSCLDCIQAPLAFCLTEFNYSGKPNYGVNEDIITQSLEATLETIAYLSRRQFELTTFQRLQCSANQLFARTKKHSQRQNYSTAKALFQLLMSGLFDNCKMESTNSESNESGTLLARAAYTEQKRRIRCDLLRYFETILSKLPSWNYFFEDTIGYGDSDGADFMRGLCSDVDSFDAKAIAYGSVVQDRVTQWLKWEDTFDDFELYDKSELQEDAELDLAWFQSFHRDVLRGTPYKSDVNAIETDLDENYKPLLNSLIKTFQGIIPEMAALFEELMVDLGRLREALSVNLKHFEDCTASEEKEAALQNLKDRVVECYGWMKEFDNMYERIRMDYGPSGDHS